MQAPVYGTTGEVVDNVEISEKVFAAPFNEAVVHQAVVRQRANARQGTHSTKTRSEVTGSSRKLFRQKGTGFARAGAITSPLRRGGGTMFGPKPRSYRQAMPKKMRRLALRCALSAKARDGELVIMQSLDMDVPGTARMAAILKAINADSTALVVTSEAKPAVVKSAGNLSGVITRPASLLNPLDVLSSKSLVMELAAVRRVEELWGDTAGPSAGAASQEMAPDEAASASGEAA